MYDRLIQIATRATMLDSSKILNMILSNSSLQHDIIELNTRGQLFDKGINSKGQKLSSIGGEYSPVTIQISEDKGRPKKGRSHIDLHDTGEFYASFFITLGEREFYIEADPIKSGGVNLLEDWGEDVLGLTDESKEILKGWLLNELAPKVLEFLLAA